MVLYNVTVTVDLPIAEEWEQWMRQKHIPDVMATGQFLNFQMSRLLDHEHPDSEIFTIQYLAQDMDTLLFYHREFAPALQKEHSDRYSGKYVAFRTVMQVLERG